VSDIESNTTPTDAVEQLLERMTAWVERRTGIISEEALPAETKHQVIHTLLTWGLEAVREAGGVVLMPVDDPTKLDKTQFVFERMGFVTDMYDVPEGMGHHYVGPGYFSSLDQVYVNVLDEQS
jgi:hypothetical protein